jgi:hypothetical protein
MLILFINSLNSLGNFSCFFHSELINTIIVRISQNFSGPAKLDISHELSTEKVFTENKISDKVETASISTTISTTDSSNIFLQTTRKTTNENKDEEIYHTNSFSSFKIFDQETNARVATDSQILFKSTTIDIPKFEANSTNFI